MECHLADCHFTECLYSEFWDAKLHYPDYHYAECCHEGEGGFCAEFCDTMCHYTLLYAKCYFTECLGTKHAVNSITN